MIRQMMTGEALLAIAAHKAGDEPRYELHRANARRLADHLQQQEAQEQRRVDECWTAPRRVRLAPGVIEGPNDSRTVYHVGGDQGRGNPLRPTPRNRNSLFASRAFWLFGIACVGAWSAFAYLVTR